MLDVALSIGRNLILKLNNPLAHEYTTGPEIVEAVTSTPSTSVHPSSGKVDVFIAGAGTGGTISGVACAIKRKHNPECIVVGVDPVRSSLAFLPHSIERRTPPIDNLSDLLT